MNNYGDSIFSGMMRVAMRTKNIPTEVIAVALRKRARATATVTATAAATKKKTSTIRRPERCWKGWKASAKYQLSVKKK